MKKNWSFWIGLGMLFTLLFLAVAGDKLPFVDPEPSNERMRFYEDGQMERAPFPPSKENLFGTDEEGRDLLSLLVLGTKDILQYVFIIVILRYIIALPLAFLASNKRGIAYSVTHIWNSFLGSIPVIFSVLLFMSLPFLTEVESTVRSEWILLFLALIEVGRTSHVFSHQLYDLSNREYVLAGRTVGVSSWSLYSRYFIPDLLPSLSVHFFLDLGKVTLLIGQMALFKCFIAGEIIAWDDTNTLTMYGKYDWPSLLATTRGTLLSAGWIPLFPALAIAFAILAFNLFGEGLRQKFAVPVVSKEPNLISRLKMAIGNRMENLQVKLGGKLKIALPVVLLAAIFAIWVVNEKDQTEATKDSAAKAPSNSETEAKPASSKPAAPAPVAEEEIVEEEGQAVQSDFVKITVVNMERVPGNDFDKPGEGKEYLVLTFALKSESQSYQYSYKEFILQDRKGENIKGILAGKFIQNEQLGEGMVPPKGRARGKVAYPVPIGETDFTLLYQPIITPVDSVSLKLEQKGR